MMTGGAPIDCIIPDLAEPITAYRTWAWDGLRLTGFGGVAWPTTESCRAECRRGRHAGAFGALWHPDNGPCTEVPSQSAHGHAGHGCGIYAYKTPDRVPLSLADGFGRHFKTQVVTGEVLLWGRVFEHTDGWRAEYAQVERIYAPIDDLDDHQVARDAAAAYAVDLAPFDPSALALDGTHGDAPAVRALVASRTAHAMSAADPVLRRRAARVRTAWARLDRAGSDLDQARDWQERAEVRYQRARSGFDAELAHLLDDIDRREQ